MPHLRAPIGASGPIVELTVWIGPEYASALIAAGRAVPPPSTVRALIDTGADRSAIDFRLAEGLALNPDELIPIRSSAMGADPVDAPVYDVQMTFGTPRGRVLPQWQAIRPVGVSVIAQGVLALIGRDLLETCLVVYDGPRAEIVVAY